MPGYVIHLTEAKIILDILKRKSQRKGKALNQWQEDFFYGSLLPDAGGRIQKQNSHFWSEAEIGQIIMTPDIDRFLKNMIMFGSSVLYMKGIWRIYIWIVNSGNII